MNKKNLGKLLKISGYAINIIIALLTLLSAYGGVVNPEKSTIPAIFAMTFPFWLGLILVVLVTDLFLNRWAAIIPGVTILLSMGPILSYCPLNITKSMDSPAPEADSFTLLSYNVFGLTDYRNPNFSFYTNRDTENTDSTATAEVPDNPTISYIISQNSDIVCMQEFYLPLNQKNPFISKAQVDTINDMYPYKAYDNINCILSKYPLYKIKVRPIDSTTANYTAAVAEIQGHRTLILSVHLESIGLDASDKALYKEITNGEGSRETIKGAKDQLLRKLSRAFRERANQTRLIRSQIDSLGIQNVIIAGDFNDIQECYAIRELSQDEFRSAYSMAGFGPIVTYYANRFYFHIDHILYRGKLEAVRFRKDNFERSDHYPIQAMFQWSRTAEKVNRNLKGIDLINRDRDTIPADTTATKQ